MELTHTVHKYLLAPQHAVTVNLIGCGGTGSQMLAKLGQIDHALRAGGLGMGAHPGLFVRVFDGDKVEPVNIGRQGFFPAEVGVNKAIALVSRVNRAFGTAWQAIPFNYDASLMVDLARAKTGFHERGDIRYSNITITCVDTAKARIQIGKMLRRGGVGGQGRRYYWLDLGNARHTGQVILGTVNDIPQPEKSKQSVKRLPTILKMFPNLKKYDTEEIQGGACSLAESLQNQDLCVNSMMAEWGKKILWNLFKQMRISSHGVFVNLESMTVNPIPIGKQKRPVRKEVKGARKK
jgi:PRTRC genetic system ThiF family protein